MVAQIKLIVTGDMEKLALHESLRRVFPTERDGDDVIWAQPRKLSCSTSHRLQEGREPSVPMRELAKAMLAEVGIGKKGQPADLVVVIDDVELGNLDREDVIARHFGAAIESLLTAYSTDPQRRYRGLLRERCSFHLLKPMVEAYLFADANALRISGVPVGELPRLVHPTDVEEFESNDPAWLLTCQAENAKRLTTSPWWRHERHPKRYLEHLAQRGQVLYDETQQGRNALAGLGWQQVPKCNSDVRLVRSLFEDIADWFGVPNPLSSGATHPQFYPSRSMKRKELLLRNL